jgi:RimJ/RimL family protein N-acetyltransferase
MAAALSLVTDRLLLRELVKADFAAVHRYASDPEVVRYMDFGPNSEEDTRSFIRRALASQEAEPRTRFGLAVVLRSEGRLIGACGIYVSASRDQEAEIGYVFAREFWGRGYGTEAVGALIRFGFEQLGLHRIVSTCRPENVASSRVMEKNGMRREGYLREERWQKGQWRDSLLYAILEGEWKASREGSRPPRA